MKTIIKRNLVQILLCFLFVLTAFAAVFCAVPVNTASAATQAFTAKIAMKPGASVRYAAPAGIRFTGYVNDSYFSDAENQVLKDGVTVGMLLVPEAKLDAGAEVVVDSTDADVKNISTATEGANWKWVNSDVEGAQKFQVAIVGKDGADFPADQYATYLMARAYVTDSEGTEYAETQNRSIAHVANAALAKDKLMNYIKSDNVLDGDKVTALDAYTAATTALSMDNHITLDGDTVVWSPVANAKGYFVRYGEQVLQVADDGRTAKYELPLSAFGEANSANGEVNIVVYGDGTNHTFENLACEYANLYKVPVAGTVGVNGVTRGFLNNFNDGNISVLNAVQSDEGTTVTVRASGSRSVFALTLADGLDLTNHSGIKVTFKVMVSNHVGVADKGLGLELVGKGTYNQGYFDDINLFRCGVNLNEEGTLYLTNENLDLWYNEGDTQIAFMQNVIFTGAADNNKWQEILISDVSYFDTLATPTNVRIEGNLLKWDEVDGASSYTVLVNENETVVETNEFDLSAITTEAVLSVCANSVSDCLVSSAYSEGVSYSYLAKNELATFNNETYVSNIGFVQGNHWNAFAEEPSYEKAGTPEGTVTFGVRKDDYRATTANWTDVSAFTVTLPKALDMANGYAGIEIKLYVNWVSKAGTVATPTVTLEMLNPTDKTTYHTASTPSVTIGDGTTAASGWMTLQVPNATLTTLGYATGDTVLTFGIRVNGSTQASGGGSSNLAIDYINYYSLADSLAANELANFNDPGYKNLVVAGNPNTTNATTKGSIRSSGFDASVGNGGAMWFAMQGDTSTWKSAGRSHIVTINLPKALDLTNNDGIEIKFLVEWISNAAATTEMRFMALHATTIDNGYKAGAPTIENGYVVATADSTKTNFQTLTLSAEQLAELGYTDGATYLTLSLWTNGDTKPGTGGSAQFWLDDISYYNEDS